MNRISLYIIIVMFLVLQPLLIAKAGVVERNIFLTEMLSLSERPKSYFLINMEENKILLMARGIVIREWVIDEIRFTGEPLPVKPFVLEKKNINLDDLRIHTTGTYEVKNDADADDIDIVNNGNNKTSEDRSGAVKKATKYELPAMEMDDMPTDYILFLNNGITVNVNSQSKGPGILYSFKSHIYYPILALWASLYKNSFTQIDIFFKDKTEAQALFWAFTDGTECIILPPGSENREDFQL